MIGMIETLITGIVAISVCMINNFCQHKAADRQHLATMKAAEDQHNTTITLIEYNLDQLTRKVDLHNNAVERLFEVEKVIGIQTEQIKVVNHRIEDLEHAERAGE